jgi:Icc-related predicted phosphoesterase
MDRESKMPRFVMISDTHSLHEQLNLPEGDILLHAGDLTGNGSLKQTREAAAWVGSLVGRFKHVIAIAGNHDFALEAFMNEGREDVAQDLFGEAHYLRDSSVNVEGFNIFGSAWSPWFMDWAFNLPRGGPIMDKWEMIPKNTDVLITHGPPQRILDKCSNGNVGCYDLSLRVREVKPLVHVFGHIHSGYGHVKQNDTDFYNASAVDEAYRVVNQPWVVDLEKHG